MKSAVVAPMMSTNERAVGVVYKSSASFARRQGVDPPKQMLAPRTATSGSGCPTANGWSSPRPASAMMRQAGATDWTGSWGWSMASFSCLMEVLFGDSRRLGRSTPVQQLASRQRISSCLPARPNPAPVQKGRPESSLTTLLWSASSSILSRAHVIGVRFQLE